MEVVNASVAAKAGMAMAAGVRAAKAFNGISSFIESAPEEVNSSMKQNIVIEITRKNLINIGTKMKVATISKSKHDIEDLVSRQRKRHCKHS